MRSADGPFLMETTYIWASVPDGTRVTLRDRCRPSGLAQVIAPVMAKAISSAMTKDLTRLAERLRHRCTLTRAVQPDDPRRSRRTMVDVARAGHPPRPETSNR